MTKTPDETKKGMEWDEVDKALQKVRFDDADEDDIRKPKTSDDIKQGLHHCSKEGCGGCPYEEDCFETDEPYSDLAKDSLALIQQLQADNAEKDERIQQLEAERDAAVQDIKGAHDSFCGCVTCKNYRVNADCHEPPSTFCPNCSHDDCPCKGCSSKLENWQWRGVQKEE